MLSYLRRRTRVIAGEQRETRQFVYILSQKLHVLLLLFLKLTNNAYPNEPSTGNALSTPRCGKKWQLL